MKKITKEIDWEKKYTILKRRYDRMKDAMNVAKKIQLATLPKEQPSFPGYDIHGRTKSLHEVGGDYYDFILLGKDKLEIILADAAGKGIEAAPITQSIHAAMDMASKLEVRDIANAVERLNDVLYESTPSDKLATMLCGELTKNRFRYVDAGHDPFYLYSNGNLSEVKKDLDVTNTGNMLLGVVPGIKYDVFHQSLGPGDILLLSSDWFLTQGLGRKGVVEVGRAIKKYHESTSEQIVDEIFKVSEKYEQTDDQTVIVIKKEKD